jgi:ferredoxin/flavodoxin---NADP+ reductase
MASPGTEGRPLRVAIVGSGPAGFYAAAALQKSKSHPDLDVQIDVYDRLPTPWGLVRGGVAPDHPNIKAVSRAFEKTAQQPGFRFFGNVEVGRAVKHEELTELYDAVVYAVGAQTDRRLGIPGEDLRGSWSATEFVAWYNGHPDFQDLELDLSTERAVVVGNGNVALDVARMLALAEEEIRPTDTTDAAIEAILASPLEEIVLLGRRGPAQASFTTPELKELGEMADADVIVDPAELELDDASLAALEADTNARRNLEVLREFAARSPAGKRRRIVLRFRVSPAAIVGDRRVEAVEVVRNELDADESGVVRAVPTDERESIPCGLVFRSVGYLAVPLPGIPFDERRATLPNDGGHVLDASGDPLPGVYCAGWIKRGATGVIGTNKKDANETVELLLADARAGLLRRGDPAADAVAVDRLLAARGVEPVTYVGWEGIDADERRRGEEQGRPRIKLTSWEELLAAARGAARVR